MNRRNEQAFAQFLIACTCGVSKIKQKIFQWHWGLQDGDCLWQEMSKQHGERCNSWLSPSQIPVCWSTQACHCCCWFWIGVYTEPICPGNKCATRIPRWWKIIQRLPTNYLWLSLQRAFEGLNGQWAFPFRCLNQAWACHERIWFRNAWFCWCCADRMHNGSVLPHASWGRMYAGRGPYKEYQRHWFVLPQQCLRNLQMTWSGVSCSRIMHMQLTNTNGKADGILNWLSWQDVLVFQWAFGLLTLWNNVNWGAK